MHCSISHNICNVHKLPIPTDISINLYVVNQQGLLKKLHAQYYYQSWLLPKVHTRCMSLWWNQDSSRSNDNVEIASTSWRHPIVYYYNKKIKLLYNGYCVIITRY